jgi:hypothetical protein
MLAEIVLTIILSRTFLSWQKESPIRKLGVRLALLTLFTVPLQAIRENWG